MPRKRQTLAAHLAPYLTKPKPRPAQAGGWVAETLLRRGEITLLVGKPKGGKTCLAATLATAVARGEPFAGFKTERTNVLYLAAEESPVEWAFGIGPYLTKVCPKRLLIVFHPLALDRPDHLDFLKEAMEKHEVGLLVIDPLLAALRHSDLKGFPAARSALLRLRALCREASAAALVVHHTHASHPVLASFAARTLVLNHRPHRDGRLVTLRESGRDLHLLSQNPGQYSNEDFVNHAGAKTPWRPPKIGQKSEEK